MRLLGRRAECEFLDALLADARAGQSRVVVLRGDAGTGKTALLEYASDRATGWRVATAVGIESEMELPYSGLHQLCAPMLDRVDRLPGPQRIALATVFGLEVGSPPDRFLVGLAALTLLADAAEQRPLLCLIDDAQWLDNASAQIIPFVARRLLAERIALVCVARHGIGDEVLVGLPVLTVAGLGHDDARALLLENLRGPVDAAVCTRLITESHGNPLALLELPRTWDVGSGFGFPAHQALASRIEESYAQRLSELPAQTRLLVLTAAAEPLGDPMLLQRASEVLRLDMAASAAAVDAGLLDVRGRIAFAHPLVRSAAYRSATVEDKRRVHAALAEATDPLRDPDRRAWHRARAAAGPDEAVAAELEDSAGRAQARGGIAAAAAFLEQATVLSPDRELRAKRSLAAAEAKQLAGDPQAASTLLTSAAQGPLGELESTLAQRLRGQIALDLRRGAEATPLLLDAASRLQPTEPELARETYLEALMAASFVGEVTLRQAAEAACGAPAPTEAPTADDLLLRGLAIRFTDGYAAGAGLIRQALRAYREQGTETLDNPRRWPGIARRAAADVFDHEAWGDLGAVSVKLARDRGALGVLPLALNNLAVARAWEGALGAAASLIEESDAIAAATGVNRITFGRLILAAIRGDEVTVSEHVNRDRSIAAERGEKLLLCVGEHASALLNNGLGRYDDALRMAESASRWETLTTTVWSLIELVEAATRCGNAELAAATLERLVERTQAAGTEWALGIEARSRALVGTGPSTERLYREAIARLGSSRLATEEARARLVYGEWLRRANRRVDAREELRAAHTMLATIGMEAFAERARRELAATGENVRRNQPERRDELTAQEAQIAQLARDGLSNPEIASQLFLSPRTVEWHLRKVFGKLGISSRRDLDHALPEGVAAATL